MPLGAVPFPFGICRICKDKATGLHYGVATCEGCKGFFKRSISKHETFKCYFGGSCDINPKTRSQCKACRFKRCMETGMSIDGVRMGRIPKVEKDKVLEAFHDGGSHYSNHELVVEQTDGGNYRFDLNKTVTASKTTNTSSNESPSCSLTPVTSVSKGNDVGYGLQSCGDAIINGSNVTPASLIDNTDEFGCIIEDIQKQPVKNLSSQAINKDAVFDNVKSIPLEDSVDTPVMFKAEGDNTFGHHFPGNQTSIGTLIDNVPSERCENPFNDKYHNVSFGKNNQHQHRNSNVSQQMLNDQRFVQNMNESFNNFSFSESAMNPLKSKATGYSKVYSNADNPIDQSDGLNLIGQRQGDDIRSFQNDITNQMEDNIERVSNKREGNFRACTSSAVQNLSQSFLGSPKLKEESEEECLRRRKSFSPTLINVLLEQVLDSQESIHVITERIHQKHQQGNLSPLVAQNLSQRLSELSASKKRRKLSDESMNSPCPENRSRKLECLDHVKTNTINELHPPPVLSLGHQDYFENAANNKESNHQNERIYRNHQADHSHVHCHHVHSDSCGMCSFNVATNVRKYEDITGAPISTGTVSSTSLSMEEENKQQQVRNTLDGINIAMRILNRLKAEHREKIRQFKLGKIYIRVMTDSEEDIKETYSKLISGIPSINERILGFCNNVPGIHDITKEDQDVLMKRAYYDIWMLCSAEYFEDDVSYLIMESGEIYSRRAMRKILNDNMVNKLFEFANQFNSLKLTDLEIAILCATRLTATDELELSDRATVAALHSHLLDVLAEEVKQNHEVAHARKLIDIFSLLPLLETVNRIQREIIAKYSV
ncbi:uncharacterized protein LOC132732304 isoform X1 [Ruditapes philippinarum]|uniref:uncharacterized protein LOC132732304 isoform X1 n=1 Tax=Ruditapes philippinarum TaxID=129788 RepID=UPI00295B4AF4|nr:uncharacterized protein LOC132732304 isoform X1 [Ruditapes philippinarum]